MKKYRLYFVGNGGDEIHDVKAKSKKDALRKFTCAPFKIEVIG